MDFSVFFEHEVFPKIRREIEYSYFLTKPKRIMLAETWFRYFYDSGFDAFKSLSPADLFSQYPEWKQPIQTICQLNPYRKQTENNVSACVRILKEVFSGFKQRFIEIATEEESAPHQAVEHKLEQLLAQEQEKKREEWKVLLKELMNLQTGYKADYENYAKQTEEISNRLEAIEGRFQQANLPKKMMRQLKQEKKALQEKLEGLKALIKDKWHLDYEALKVAWWSEHLQEAAEEIQTSLILKLQHAEHLMKIFGDIGMFLGRGWDMSQGLWQDTHWNQLERYASLLEDEKGLQELAELLGRYESEETLYEMEERKHQKIVHQWKPEKGGKAQITGVHQSDDLSYMLPSESALLGNKMTRPLFYQKFTEKKLMTYKMDDKVLFAQTHEETRLHKKRKEDKKGPVIVCVDTSGSMHGAPEKVAKVMTFALLKIALKENRPCYLISFSDSQNIHELELTELDQSLDKLVEFLRHSFHGGTDAMPALNRAIEMIEQETYKKADILLITDGIFGVTENFIQRIQVQKEEKQCLIHSLIISPNVNKEQFSFCDQTWHYSQDKIREGIIFLNSLRGSAS